MKFRTLNADEIECRVGSINDKGLSLLLYKDARCDMRVLDETVGAFNWQKSYTRDNANCTVSIWDEGKQQWISKEDTGTESNTEKEKGLASDSFKRACFNWGIGRELYTAPFIWIPAGKCKIEVKGTKYVCYDRFSVGCIEYAGGRIVKLTVLNGNNVVFSYAGKAPEVTEVPKEDEPVEVNGKIGSVKGKALTSYLQMQGVSEKLVCSLYKVKRLDELTERQHRDIFDHIEDLRGLEAKDGV